jgi:hypothetical protein
VLRIAKVTIPKIKECIVGMLQGRSPLPVGADGGYPLKTLFGHFGKKSSKNLA